MGEDDTNVNETMLKNTDVNESSEILKDPRKMWVHVKATGDMLEIDLDRDRPISFESQDAEVQWERATANNALKFKESVESGQFIPEEIRKKLEQKVNRTPQEEEILQKEKQMQSRKEKIRFLQVEQRIIDLDHAIKVAVHYEHPDMPKCLELLDELYQLPVTTLMLKKQPDIVTTIRKLRKYIGPQIEPADPQMGKYWEVNSQRIRFLAEQIILKFSSDFTINEDDTFWDVFDKSVAKFREMTKNLDPGEIVHLVIDPMDQKKISSK